MIVDTLKEAGERWLAENPDRWDIVFNFDWSPVTADAAQLTEYMIASAPGCTSIQFAEAVSQMDNVAKQF